MQLEMLEMLMQCGIDEIQIRSDFDVNDLNENVNDLNVNVYNLYMVCSF